MCFSPTASFGSAAVLTALGFGASKLNETQSQKMFVAIPFFFGVQQAAEGFVWLTMTDNTTKLHQAAVFIFLFFAMAIWPSWVSWSVYRAENEPARKKVLGILALIGTLVSLATTWMLLSVPPRAYISGHSLTYSTNNLHLFIPANLEFLAYISATLVPFFISSIRYVRNTGWLILGGLFLSFYINREATTSVWCFFAALASLYITFKVFSRSALAKSRII
ncbi:MAG: DUF6629 family protein [Pseudobdellovibrio sp.]